MTVRGVDVSGAQRPDACDWGTACRAGLQFVYVKGSEGAGGSSGAYVDKAAPEHIAKIRRTSCLVGMYHVARPVNRFNESNNATVNGMREAEHAIATALALGVAYNALPIAIDLEKYTPAELGVTDAQRCEFVRAMVDTIAGAFGRKPVVYAGSTYWGYQLTPEFATELRNGGVPLWLVNYTANADPTRTIGGWPWSMWQHSGGRARAGSPSGQDFATAPPWPGLPDPVDQNVYRGTIAELRALAFG